MLRILLVFGVSFEIPLFVVLLSLAGVVHAYQLKRWRAWIVFGTFVFAAVATPSTDPITMLFLALPMVGLFLISELIAIFVDRRRAAAGDPDYAAYHDDEASPLG
jgi:sec-independent protein translocase protein TatC